MVFPEAAAWNISSTAAGVALLSSAGSVAPKPVPDLDRGAAGSAGGTGDSETGRGVGVSVCPKRLKGGDTWRDDDRDSTASENGRFGVASLDSGGGGRPLGRFAGRLKFGVAEVGVANEPALPVEVPVVCGLKMALAGGGGVPD